MTDDSARLGSNSSAETGNGRADVWVAVISGAFGVLIALAGGFKWGSESVDAAVALGPTTTVTASPGPSLTKPVRRTITSPRPGEQVPVCVEVAGVVTDELPAGKTLVIAQREERDKNIYFSHSATIGIEGQWAALIDIGQRENPKAAIGRRFDIYALVIDKALADYLASTNRLGEDWWFTPTWPPGSDPGEPVRVVRSEQLGTCN